MPFSRPLLPILAAAALLSPGSLHAASVFYSFSGTAATGSLNGVPFTAKSFTITTAGNTANVLHLPDSGLYLDIHSISAEPTIELITDIGNFKLTLPLSKTFIPTIQSANYDGKTPVYSLNLAGTNPVLIEKISELLSLDPKLFAKDQDLFNTVASFFSKEPDLKNTEFAEKYPDLFLQLSSLPDKDPALFEQIVKTFSDYPGTSTLELASSSGELNDLRSSGEFDGLWSGDFSLSTESSMGDLSLSLDGSSFDGTFAINVFDGPSDPSHAPEPATAASALLLSIAGLSLVSRRNRKA